MKQSKCNRFFIILMLIGSSISIFATPIAIVVPIIQQALEIAIQCLLAIGITAAHYANIKPHFSSQAESQGIQ